MIEVKNNVRKLIEENDFIESLMETNKKYAEMVLFYKKREDKVKELEEAWKGLSEQVHNIFDWNNNKKIEQIKFELNHLQSFEIGDGRIVVYLKDILNLLDSFKEAEDGNNE